MYYYEVALTYEKFFAEIDKYRHSTNDFMLKISNESKNCKGWMLLKANIDISR